MKAVPEVFLRYRGNSKMYLVGVAFGPDGLYYIPLFPNERGVSSAIYKVSYDPDNAHPYNLNDIGKYRRFPGSFLAAKGCYDCHRETDIEAVAAKIGPSLDRATLAKRLAQRLNSKAYLASLRTLNAKSSEPEFKEQRDAVLAASPEERPRLWMKYELLNPRFDNPSSRMPEMGLSEAEIDFVVNHLLTPATPRRGGIVGLYRAIREPLGEMGMKHVMAAFFAAAMMAGFGARAWHSRSFRRGR